MHEQRNEPEGIAVFAPDPMGSMAQGRAHRDLNTWLLPPSTKRPPGF